MAVRENQNFSASSVSDLYAMNSSPWWSGIICTAVLHSFISKLAMIYPILSEVVVA